MTHPDMVTKITNRICGPYPDGIEKTIDNYKRLVIFGLVGHYLGMAEQPYMSPAWRAESSGWCNTISACEGASEIASLMGSNVLEKLNIAQWPTMIIDACREAGYVAQGGFDGKNTG